MGAHDQLEEAIAVASHRALTAVPEARSTRPAAPVFGDADLLDVFRTPTSGAPHAVERDDFSSILAARPVAVLERPAVQATPVPPGEAPARSPLAPTAPAPTAPAPVFRSRAERRAAERTGQTPPWGVPVVAPPAVTQPHVAPVAALAPAAALAPVAAPPQASRPASSAPATRVLPAHHVIPVSGAVPPGSIDPQLFEDNARTAPQPVLPSRRELRQRETGRRPKVAVEQVTPGEGAGATTVPSATVSATAAEPVRSAPARQGVRASHVAIVGTLGIATIAVPLSGALAPPAAEPVTASVPVAMPVAPQFPGLVREPSSVDALTVLPSTRSLGGPLPAALARPRLVLVDGQRASRGNERSVLPGCDGKVARTTAANGQLDVHDLCTLWNRKHRLRADAAVALAKLNIAYERRFGHEICLTDSYRTLSEQRRLKAIKPGLAATPGTSEHGWGLAVDMCDNVERGSSVQYRWLRANAADYGWANPDWALPGGSGPYEPWHWEFVAGE